MALTGKLGLLVAGVGAAHFVAPQVFEAVTAAAFPTDTDTWVLRNGATEVALGTLTALPPTRRLGVLGLLGYVGWLGYRASAAQR